MNPLSVAVLFVTIAAACASGIIGDRGALEGALGGQWIPDVPADGHAGAGVLGAGVLGAGLLGAGHGVSAKGALEGALGGQWIPDVPVAHAGPAVVAAGPLGLGWGAGLGAGWAGAGWAGPGALWAGPGAGWGGAGWGHGASRGALEGALGGQWIPDTHGHH